MFTIIATAFEGDMIPPGPGLLCWRRGSPAQVEGRGWRVELLPNIHLIEGVTSNAYLIVEPIR